MTVAPLFKFERAYFVETATTNPVNPVAIRPESFENRVQWMDTSKGKVVLLGKVENIDKFEKKPPDLIELTSKEGERYRLHNLTLDLYNKRVKDRVMLPPSFD